jgi:hypothetical protein
MSNPILDVMEYYDDVLNRQNFIATAYPGKPPGKLDNESEAELPDEPRFKRFPEKTHEEEVAEEAESESKKKNNK